MFNEAPEVVERLRRALLRIGASRSDAGRHRGDSLPLAGLAPSRTRLRHAAAGAEDGWERNGERSERRRAAANGGLRTGGGGSDVVVTKALAGAQRGRSGLDRNAGQLRQGHPRRRQRVAGALLDLRITPIEARAELGRPPQVFGREKMQNAQLQRERWR